MTDEDEVDVVNTYVNRLLEEFKYLGESQNKYPEKCEQCNFELCKCIDM